MAPRVSGILILAGNLETRDRIARTSEHGNSNRKSRELKAYSVMMLEEATNECPVAKVERLVHQIPLVSAERVSRSLGRFMVVQDYGNKSQELGGDTDRYGC